MEMTMVFYLFYLPNAFPMVIENLRMGLAIIKRGHSRTTILIKIKFAHFEQKVFKSFQVHVTMIDNIF